MIQHTFHWAQPVNLSLLHLEMVAEFGEQFFGFNASESQITGYFDDALGDDDGELRADVLAAAQAVLEAHDHTKRTPEQEIAERESAAIGELKAVAHETATSLEVALENWQTLTADDKDDLLKQLAQTQAQMLLALARLLRQSGG